MTLTSVSIMYPYTAVDERRALCPRRRSSICNKKVALTAYAQMRLIMTALAKRSLFKMAPIPFLRNFCGCKLPCASMNLRRADARAR